MILEKCSRCGTRTDRLVIKNNEKICVLCDEYDQDSQLKSELLLKQKVEFEGTVSHMGRSKGIKVIWVPKNLRNLIKAGKYKITLEEVKE